MGIKGTGGDDVLTGTGGDDTFDLVRGGEDRASGLGGDDLFHMGAAFDAGDRIDGGDGFDRLVLRGDYSSGVIFGLHTLTNVEAIQLRGGFSYSLTASNATVAAGETLKINAIPLQAGQSLVFDGSHEKNGSFLIYAGAGDDTLTGGKLGDAFHLGRGGADIANGGGGNDTFMMSASFDAADRIQGGNGADTLVLKGDYSSLVTFSDSTIASIETLKLNPGHDYNLVLAEGNVAAGQTLTIDAGHLGTNGDAFIDGGALTAGTLHFIDGAGQNVFTGGSGGDVFDLQNGQLDTVSGGGGDDTFNLGANFTVQFGVHGGSGTNTMTFDGDPGIALGGDGAGSAITNIQTLAFLGNHTYTDVQINGDIAGGGTLTLDGSAAASVDIVLTGATSTAYAITGSGGDDSVAFAANFAVGDTFNGGAGNDTLTLDGNYFTSLTFGAATMTGVENLVLNGLGYGDVKLNDANIAAGATLTIHANAFGANTLIDASAETDGHLNVIDGSQTINVIGGDQSDTVYIDDTDTLTSIFHGNGGDDVCTQAGGMRLFDGGSGNDTFVYDGTGSESFYGLSEFQAGDVQLGSVETLKAGVNTDVGFTVTDAVVTAGNTLTVDASVLTGAHTFTFNGSAETDGKFNIIGGAGADTITGSALADTFNLAGGGNDTVHGGGGGDVFNFGANLTAADTIDGGSGNDTVNLNGVYAITLGASTLTGVETLSFSNGHDYIVRTDNANVAAGQTLTVDASALGSGSYLTFDGGAETDGTFHIIGGADLNTMRGGLGGDTLTGGSGHNVFFYFTGSESTGATYDTITNMDFASDQITLNPAFDPTAIDGPIGSGTLDSGASFDTDLAAAVDAANLGAHHAVLFHATAGSLSGQDFLIVDMNGTAGYQHGDLVIDITGYSDTLSTGIFG